MSHYSEDGTLMRDDSTFMCQACLDYKDLSELSPKDARYCTFCQPIVEYEYSISSRNTYEPTPPQKPTETAKTVETPNPMDAGVEEVLLHTNLKNTRAYQNPTQTPIINLGGRPRKDIPVDLIYRLSKQGLGVREIVRELKEYKVSAMTVSRVLSGERTPSQ